LGIKISGGWGPLNPNPLAGQLVYTDQPSLRHYLNKPRGSGHHRQDQQPVSLSPGRHKIPFGCPGKSNLPLKDRVQGLAPGREINRLDLKPSLFKIAHFLSHIKGQVKGIKSQTQTIAKLKLRKLLARVNIYPKK
jgi:hypothetical protein